MVLTESFKNECERIFKAWKELVATPWGKSYTELNKYLLAGKDKVLDDPFFASFKTSRTLEEIKWMLKRLQKYYTDEKEGIYYYVSYVYQNGADNGATELTYNYQLLRMRFMKNLNEGGMDVLEREAKTKEDKITQLQADKTKAETERDTANQDKQKLSDQITILTNDKATAEKERDNLKTDNAKKDTALAEKDNTINNLNQQLAKATTADDEKLKLLQKQLADKNDEISQLNQYKEEILKNKRASVKKELNLFRQKVGIDDDDINEAFGQGFDYEDVIDEQLTLSNEKSMKTDFKVLACIFATKRVKELKEKSKEIGSKFLAILKGIKEAWEELEKDSQIGQEKSPFYLSDIDKWSESKKDFDDLMSEVGTTSTKRGIEVRDLSEQTTVPISSKGLSEKRTIFEILGSKEIKTEFEEYLNWLKEQYPSAKDKIEEIWQAKVQKDWGEFSNETGREDWLVLIRRFTFDNTIIEKVKTEAKEKLEGIFSIKDSDSEAKKYLKGQARDKLLEDFSSYKADEIAYAVELCYNETYLGWLTEHIDEILKSNNLTLKEVDQKVLESLREKTFTDLYKTWDNTVDKSELDKLSKEINADVVKWDNLVAGAAKAVADELKTAKEKAKKEDIDGRPWTLTASEKSRIDQAANKQDLEKVVRDIMKEKDDRDKFEKWIKENISDKTKTEDLPSEAEIDNNADFSPSAKQQAKWKLQEKKIELMPETTAKGKIKKHLMRVKFDWEKWNYLVEQKDKTNPADYAMALMFAEGSKEDKQGFGKTVAQEMLPKIIAAIAKDTMEDYRNLDKEWGQSLLEDGKVKYNEDRDYYGVWENLRKYLYANKDEWMKDHLRGVYGDNKFQEYENLYQGLQAQIEVLNNK